MNQMRPFEQSDESTLDLGELDFSEFESFWRTFPRRRDRRRAEGAFARARKLSSFEDIISAARAYADDVEGVPVERIRWPNEWLRASPWLPSSAPVTPRPAPQPRGRRDPSKPRRAPHKVTRVRDSAEAQKRRWCHERGITVDEYEKKKGDAEWLSRMKNMETR